MDARRNVTKRGFIRYTFLLLLILVALYFIAIFNHTQFQNISSFLRPLWETPPPPFQYIPHYYSENASINNLCDLHGWTLSFEPCNVFDAILFSNELDLLELRWRELYQCFRFSYQYFRFSYPVCGILAGWIYHAQSSSLERKREPGKLALLYEVDVLSWSSIDFVYKYHVSTMNSFGSVLLQSPSTLDIDQRDMFSLYLFAGPHKGKKVGDTLLTVDVGKKLIGAHHYNKDRTLNNSRCTSISWIPEREEGELG
ncbi:hypothetical protein Lser_V15G18217 [Lactuca serriola]